MLLAVNIYAWHILASEPRSEGEGRCSLLEQGTESTMLVCGFSPPYFSHNPCVFKFNTKPHLDSRYGLHCYSQVQITCCRKILFTFLISFVDISYQGPNITSIQIHKLAFGNVLIIYVKQFVNNDYQKK